MWMYRKYILTIYNSNKILTFANNNLIITKNNVTIMGILFFICIIMAIVIYCLAKQNKEKPANITKKPIMPNGEEKAKSTQKLSGPFSRTWTLAEFSREFGSMQFSDSQINSDTGEVFTSCRFIKNNNKTYVNFHKSLGVLTKEEILQKKDDLRVGLNMNDKYVLFIGEAGSLDNVDLRL